MMALMIIIALCNLVTLVTPGHRWSHLVTDGHTWSQMVTPGHIGHCQGQ